MKILLVVSSEYVFVNISILQYFNYTLKWLSEIVSHAYYYQRMKQFCKGNFPLWCNSVGINSLCVSIVVGFLSGKYKYVCMQQLPGFMNGFLEWQID